MTFVKKLIQDQIRYLSGLGLLKEITDDQTTKFDHSLTEILNNSEDLPKLGDDGIRVLLTLPHELLSLFVQNKFVKKGRVLTNEDKSWKHKVPAGTPMSLPESTDPRLFVHEGVEVPSDKPYVITNVSIHHQGYTETSLARPSGTNEKSLAKIRKELETNRRRGLTAAEAIAMFIQFPETMNTERSGNSDFNFDLLGSYMQYQGNSGVWMVKAGEEMRPTFTFVSCDI